ncbi:hypothetical protein [Actinoplanes sp. NPDC048796]|uniref:hypothetical protein n=1 Tax=unclassified Actinoplanes TaxID=2626549 RepID=UPI0033E73C34
MALPAFGGAIGLLRLGAALDSSSITGETMVTMFLPSIPIAIAANVPAELVVIPGLLIFAALLLAAFGSRLHVRRAPGQELAEVRP